MTLSEPGPSGPGQKNSGLRVRPLKGAGSERNPEPSTQNPAPNLDHGGTEARRIGILQYSAGNLTSVALALERLDIPYRRVETVDELERVEGLIFPGVGAAGAAMDDLRSRGFDTALREFKKPFLGLCLGMQLLFERSEEGDTEGLGLLPGKVRRFPPEAGCPHIGWNRLSSGQWVYFAHSYYCEPEDPGIVTETAWNGVRFCASLRRGQIFGAQYHPEKSGPAGDALLRGFAALCR